jgi:branched-subunit amino acid ABC-type transport system permease component
MAMRGVVDNRDLIGLFGGRAARLSTLSWAIGTSLASVAGILDPRLQLRSLPMTFFGALVVGLASSYALGYLPSSRIWASAPFQGLLTLSVPSVILFMALPVLPMHRIRRGAPRRHAPLAPASFVRSSRGPPSSASTAPSRSPGPASSASA